MSNDAKIKEAKRHLEKIKELLGAVEEISLQTNTSFSLDIAGCSFTTLVKGEYMDEEDLDYIMDEQNVTVGEWVSSSAWC